MPRHINFSTWNASLALYSSKTWILLWTKYGIFESFKHYTVTGWYNLQDLLKLLNILITLLWFDWWERSLCYYQTLKKLFTFPNQWWPPCLQFLHGTVWSFFCFNSSPATRKNAVCLKSQNKKENAKIFNRNKLTHSRLW